MLLPVLHHPWNPCGERSDLFLPVLVIVVVERKRDIESVKEETTVLDLTLSLEVVTPIPALSESMRTGDDLELGVLVLLVVAMEPRHVPDVVTVQPPVTGDDIAPGRPQREGSVEGEQHQQDGHLMELGVDVLSVVDKEPNQEHGHVSTLIPNVVVKLDVLDVA